MFYSDTLLSKTGPLARVWLASNMERKLTKKDCLSSNLESSIEVMVDQGSAPMALRLSGQLLLGVCRIYSRKTRYLLEDCNEALLKIQMSFRPGNVDVPREQIREANVEALNLPDSLTDMDLLANIPLLLEQTDLAQLLGTSGALEDTVDWGTQNLLPHSTENRAQPEVRRGYEVDDLGLVLEDDDDDIPQVERGRDRVEVPWADEAVGGDITKHLLDDDNDLAMGNVNDLDTTMANDNDNDMSMPPLALEDINMSDINDLDMGPPNDTDVQDRDRLIYLDANEETVVQATHRPKRRKVIQLDADLTLSTVEMREQQRDRSRTMKPSSFLSRDPLLLSLLNMHKSGGFVSHILGNERTSAWAPELRSVFSMQFVRRSGELKRKRDLGPGSKFSTESAISPSRYRSPSELGLLLSAAPESRKTPEVGEIGVGLGDEEELPTMPPMSPGAGGMDNFDDTTMPLLHPAEAGPVSQGTQHVVHMLRQHFGAEGENSSEQRQQSSVLFHDLLPESRTSRSDATKMFFEVLVLATKDAIKVEQKSDSIGGTLKIRAKRGLWGAWAEQVGSRQQSGDDGEQKEQQVEAPNREDQLDVELPSGNQNRSSTRNRARLSSLNARRTNREGSMLGAQSISVA